MPDQYLPGMRDPDEETEDYPGLIVHDGRVTGSITLGRSRLPVWAFGGDWSYAEQGWTEHYGWDRSRWDAFLGNLLEQRGDFARLLCVLADVERQEGERTQAVEDDHFATAHPDEKVCDGCMPPAADMGWWQHDDLRGRVVDALTRCMTALEES